MDLSEVPTDSAIPLYVAIVGIVTLPVPLAMLHQVLKLPKVGPNATTRRLLLVCWSFLTFDQVVYVAYAFLTPQCPVIYKHVYPSYKMAPCIANALYPASHMGGPIGHLFSTIALLRRFRPILDTLSSNALKAIVRLGPIVTLLSTIILCAIEIRSVYYPVPSPSLALLPVDSWFLSTAYVLDLYVHAIFGSICYVAAIMHVRKVLGEVDRVQGKGSSSSPQETVSMMQAQASGVPQSSNASQVPSGVSLAMQERAQWRQVNILSVLCLLQILAAVAYVCGVVPSVLDLPVVVQVSLTNISVKTYLISEYILMNNVRRALEMNQARRTATIISLKVPGAA